MKRLILSALFLLGIVSMASPTQAEDLEAELLGGRYIYARQAWVDKVGSDGVLKAEHNSGWVRYQGGRIVAVIEEPGLAGKFLLIGPRGNIRIARTKVSRLSSYVLFCGAKAADLASTEYAFSRNPAAYETNRMPGMQSSGGRVAWGVGTCVVAAEMDRKLAKHTKSKWIFRAIGLGLMGYAVQQNLRVANRGVR